MDPARDDRLRPLLAAIDAGGLSALSLDCFDTTCGRAVPRPVAAFRRLGERLAARGLLAAAIHPAAFVALRSGAEERARRRRPGRLEVHLADVYAEIPAAILPPERRREAEELELEVEAELAIVDPAVVAVAAHARARGLRVAIASDTYLSAPQLAALLRRAGCELEPDLVVTSSDEGLCKAGGLLRVVAARLGLAPARIAHLGDDPAADVLAAASAGMKAFPYPAGDDELRAVLARERALTLESAVEDAGLTFLRRRAIARSGAAGAARARQFRLGATVFGPVFTAFAEWLVDRLVELRAAGAVAFMREGEFLAQLVAAAGGARGIALDVSPLWISRCAAARAALSRLDAATLEEAAARREPARVDEFCRSFGIEARAAKLPPKTWTASMGDAAVARRVFAALLEPAARARIERSAAAQRALLVDLVRTRAPPDGPLVCIDLGWGATIQRHLVTALRLARERRDVVGLYLAASPRAAAAMLEGSCVRGFLASPGDHDALAELVARSPEVVEQLCTPYVGSVVEYERDGSGSVAPVLGAMPPDAAGARDRAAVRDGVRFFQAQYLAMRRPSHGAIPIAEVRRVLARFLAWPQEAEAELVGGWWHDENLGSGASLAIAPRVPAAALARRSTAQLYENRTVLWPAGVAARGHPALAEQLAAHALLGAFGAIGRRDSEAGPAARHVLADELDAAVRFVAPRAYKGCAWALSRWAGTAGTAPLRHQIADSVNDRLKRLAPSLHARAKAAAVDAMESRGAILWPAARRMSAFASSSRAGKKRRSAPRPRRR